MPVYLLPLSSNNVDPALVGGKGINLVKLKTAGLPVPEGFILSTRAYQDFVKANQIGEKIYKVLKNVKADDPASLQEVSGKIRGFFSNGQLPPQLSEEIKTAAAEIKKQPVAVRSSATAEDLPDMSFAGLQDTYLNIIGETALVQAVINCWSSLWTARAIGYRLRNQVPNESVALSVVVQFMVPAESAGVLFTANPLSGERGQYVIDATLGLGEALVSGLVEPDHYEVDIQKNRISSKKLGAKETITRALSEGGVVNENIQGENVQALSDEQILRLTELGKQVYDLYKTPQDIEWAFSNGKVYLLQSRAITSLFPVPDNPQAGETTQVYFSFGAVQGLLDPITPLGQDFLRLIFAGGSDLLGFKETYETQRVLYEAGGRLWGNFTSLIRNSLGKRFLPIVLPIVEPGAAESLNIIFADPRMQAGKGKIRAGTILRLLKFILPIYAKTFRNMLFPKGKVKKLQFELEEKRKSLQEKAKAIPDSGALGQVLEYLQETIFDAFPYLVPRLIPAMLAGMLPLILLNKISNKLSGSNKLALELTRGLPFNVTTEMDLKLWGTAQSLKNDRQSREIFENSEISDLVKAWQENTLPQTVRKAVKQFLDEYGMRGVGEIDGGRQRWREDSAHIFQILKTYLQIENPEQAPDVVFKKGEKAAQNALQELQNLARKTFGGRLKAHMIGELSKRLRSFAGLRETPKFHIIQRFGFIRNKLLVYGQGYMRAGLLKKSDDLYFLTLNELKELAGGQEKDWKTLAASRRAEYEKEKRRTQIPRLIMSSGRAFYDGMGALGEGDNLFKGSPVSPGVAKGCVRVVFDPQNSELVPGEILVCPGTDPAWTPLFLSAGGLITEVGGMMTHGAIVAREYGIPAIVGVHQVCQRLQTGQLIRMDGSSGQIALIKNEES